MWKRAELRNGVPTDDELDDLALIMQQPRFAVESTASSNHVVKIGDCRALTFHAIAKGLIVDLAVQHVVTTHKLKSAMINIGGDLRH